MNEERNPFYRDDFEDELVHRYEEMLKKEKQFFFDVHEFEDIIDHYLENEQFNKASRAINIAKHQHPASSVFALKDAQVLIDCGEPVKAIRLLNSVEQLESFNDEVFLLKASAYHMLGELKEAIRQWERALELNHDDKDEQLFSIGIHLETGGHYKLAIKYFKQALEINPKNLGVFYEIAFCYEKIGDIKQSIDYYNHYLDVEPYSEMIWFRMGQVYEKNEQYEEAVKAFDYASIVEEKFSLAYLSKAKCLDKLGRDEEALQEYKIFLENEDSDPDAYVNIGYCYEELNKVDKAIEYYKKALELEPDHAEAAFCIGQVLYEKGELAKSLPYLQHAVVHFEAAAEYWYVLGCAYNDLENTKDAKTSFKRALHLEQDILQYWIDYSEVYFREGKVERALKIIYDASSYCSEDAGVYYYFGIYLFYLGDIEKSIDNFKKGLKEDPLMMDEILKNYPEILQNEDIRQLSLYLDKKI